MIKKKDSLPARGDAGMLRRLALFRYELRRFLRFSERAARECGVTPQQHQLLLSLAGFAPDGSASISQLAEYLQERHNAVVGLVERAARRRLVRKARSSGDQRVVWVSLTRRGAAVIRKLSRLHWEELGRMRGQLPRGFKLSPPSRAHSLEA